MIETQRRPLALFAVATWSLFSGHPLYAQNVCATRNADDQGATELTYQGISQGFDSVAVIRTPSSAPLQGAGALAGKLVEGLTAASQRIKDVCNGQGGSDFIPNFEVDTERVRSEIPETLERLTTIGIDFKPNNYPDGDRQAIWGQESAQGDAASINTITVFGLCRGTPQTFPAGLGSICVDPNQDSVYEVDWSRDHASDLLIHELFHALGLGHDLETGACQQVEGIMRSEVPLGASIEPIHCEAANSLNCDGSGCPQVPPLQLCKKSSDCFPQDLPCMPFCANNPRLNPCQRVPELCPIDIPGADNPWYAARPETGIVCTVVSVTFGSETTSERNCYFDRAPAPHPPPFDFELEFFGPTVGVEEPTDVLSDIVTIDGGASQPVVGTSAIAVWLDGEPIEPLTLERGVFAPEYCEHVAGGSDPDCPNVGFRVALDTRDIPNGLHRLLILVADGGTWAEVGGHEFSIEVHNGLPSAPDINVVRQWDSQTVPHGGGYDFGSWDVAELPQARLFLVCNDGNAALQITNIASIVSGTGFQKGFGPTSPIAPGACSQLQLRFDTGDPGSYSGAATIESNDPDEPTYSFALSGTATGIVDTQAPRLFIGRPLTDEVISGVFLARGWALDATWLSASNLSFEIDGQPWALESFVYGSYRPGACDANQDLNSPNCPDVGWEGNLDTTLLANGSHTITMRGVDSSGNERTKTTTFAVDNPQLVVTWSLDVNANGTWDGVPPDAAWSFNYQGGIPVAGDWDGDGRSSAGSFAAGWWRLDTNENGVFDGCGIDACGSFGLGGDQPVVGDWNGDGKDEIGVFRNGNWSLDSNGNLTWDGVPTDADFPYGVPGDLAAAGDWNGDGTAEVGVFKDGWWHLDVDGDRSYESCQFDACGSFGVSGDLPVTGDWNADGFDEVGVQRGSHWSLDRNGNLTWDGVPTDLDFDFGMLGDDAVSGDWNGTGLDGVGVVRTTQ